MTLSKSHFTEKIRHTDTVDNVHRVLLYPTIYPSDPPPRKKVTRTDGTLARMAKYFKIPTRSSLLIPKARADNSKAIEKTRWMNKQTIGQDFEVLA